MTYETRMHLRLAAPCALSAGLTGLAVWIATTLADLPLRLGAPTSPLVDVPLVIGGLGTLITTGVVAWQVMRLARLEAGTAPQCLSCGCLLGEPRQRRWSVCRQCLGCGKFAPADQCGRWSG